MMLVHSNKKDFSWFSGILLVLLTLFSFGLVFLLLWALMSAFKTSDAFDMDALAFPAPGQWTFSNFTEIWYQMVIEVQNIFDPNPHYVGVDVMFLYSLVYAGGCAFVQTFTTVTMAYISARYPSPLSKIIDSIVLVTLIMPVVGNTASLLQVMHFLHLYDNILGAFVMKCAFNNVYYFIFRAAFSRVPRDYAESASIDGAGHFHVYTSIYLPIIAPLFWTIFLLLFISYWNDYQVPYLFFPDQPTLALGLFALANYPIQNGGKLPTIQIASGIAVFIPIFILFMAFRKKIMSNIDEGGVKG